MNRKAITLVAAASFEERSLVITQEFVERIGDIADVYLANVIEDNIQYRENVAAFRELGIERIEPVNRLDSRDLWRWTWKTIETAPGGDIIVDITCFPRELLGMVLFAIALMRRKFDKVTVEYIAAPAAGYATQNPALQESERWLSQGVRDIRSIIGYPGDFSGEKSGHLIALAGHEEHRMMEIVEYVEPRKLSIGGGQRGSATAAGADEYSGRVVRALTAKVPVPSVRGFGFRSDSVHDVYESLRGLRIDFGRDNVSLTAMNTKLAFVGAALFALEERRVRVMYAVPDRYNPVYCQGIGKRCRFEITELIGQANTDAL